MPLPSLSGVLRYLTHQWHLLAPMLHNVFDYASQNPTLKFVGIQISDIHLSKSGGILDLGNFGVFLSGVINVTVEVGNPNKFSINVQTVDIDVSYSNVSLSNTTVSIWVILFNA